MGIVDRVKEKGAEINESISSIEKKCGLGHGTIRRWNDNSPAVDKAKLVADYLQVSLEWLVTGKEAGELSPEEQQLVDYYKNSNSIGQKIILDNARTISEQLPAELESSTFKNGSTGTGKL